MIRVVGKSWRIMRVASIPPRRGMRTSMRTTSGASSSTRATASWPSAASATTSMSSSASRTMRRPRRNRSWSSEMTTRMGSSPPRPGWGTSAPSGDGGALAGFDEADIAVVATVDDRGHTVGVVEEVEVVPEHVHLQGRLLRCHRLHVELLGLDDAGRALLVWRRLVLIGDRCTGVYRVVLRMRPADQAALELVDLVLELVDHLVERRHRVGRRRLGPDDAPVAPQRRLTDLLGRDAGVALLDELDLRLLPTLVVAGEPADLLLGRGPQPLGDLNVATTNGHVHDGLLDTGIPECMPRR